LDFFVLTTMISVLKVLLFIALVAASVAVLPRCSFAGSSSGPTGQYRAGCMCRFDDGSQKCVLKGPTGYDLSYLESSLSPYGVYYAASTSSGGTTYSGMCTVSSGTAPFLSGNTFANAIERMTIISRIESLLANGSIDVNARLPRKVESACAGSRRETRRGKTLSMCFCVSVRALTTLTTMDALLAMLRQRPSRIAGVAARASAQSRSQVQEWTTRRSTVHSSFHDGERDRIAMMLIEAGAPLEVSIVTLCPSGGDEHVCNSDAASPRCRGRRVA
jgi:hypothetical protein